MSLLQGTIPEDESHPKVGILTRTIIKGPVIRWLLAAQLDDTARQYLVSVGNDFVKVQAFDQQGDLVHVIAKEDFDATIRAAKVFNHHRNIPESDPFVKSENGSARSKPLNFTQSIVLTLDTNELLFLALSHAEDSRPRFIAHHVPIPSFSRTLFQPGEHLAIDPSSQALAVAALESQVVVYAVVDDGIGNSQTWPPKLAQRFLTVDGVIIHLEFLHPATDDVNHIILLLIVIEDQKIKAIWLDWYRGGDVHHALLHPAQPLEAASSVPSVLVPLRNAAFILIHETEAKRWKHLTTGSATSQSLEIAAGPATHPGSTSKYPQWTTWARPPRTSTLSRNLDNIYLGREDGIVNLLQVADDNLSSCIIADVGCAIGTAFVTLGNGWDDDILAAAGDMSTGRLISIPQAATLAPNLQDDVDGTPEADLIHTIPNWASVTDLLPADAIQGHSRTTPSANSVFVTSGRQPFGSITELRRGYEAQLLLYMELEDLETMTTAWILPYNQAGTYIIMLSGPGLTKLFELTGNGESTTELNILDCPWFDFSARTLAAASLLDGTTIQITDQSVRVKKFEAEQAGHVTWPCSENTGILVGSISIDNSGLVLGIRKEGRFVLQALSISKFDQRASFCVGDEDLGTSSLALSSEPVAIKIVVGKQETWVLVASVDGHVHLVTTGIGVALEIIDSVALPDTKDGHATCDSISCVNLNEPPSILVVCGLRDGRIASYKLDVSGTPRLHAEPLNLFVLGKTTAKLTPLSEQTICATSGSDAFYLSWDEHSSALSINNIWIADKLQPELAQGPLSACVPVISLLTHARGPLNGALMFLTTKQLMFARLGPEPSTVPRHIPVTGTPNRLIYMTQQRCLVCASIRSDVRHFAVANARPELRRQIYAVLDFIPIHSTQPSFTYKMQPGSKVYALLEWSINFGSDKTYSYILVGGSYVRRNGSERGRIMMIQPTNRRWKIVDVSEGLVTKFEEPVYALALYDEMTYVACCGHNVHVQRFLPDLKRWASLCPPYRLSSRGVHLTVSNGVICVSTATDSLFSLLLRETEHDRFELVLVQLPPKSNVLLSHLIVDAKDERIALCANKYSQLTGMIAGYTANGPQPPQATPSSTRILFEAQLPRSVTRLRHANTRPGWKPAPPKEVLNNSILGSCADGTIMGIAIINNSLWRRLFWLQRICEWHATYLKKHPPLQEPTTAHPLNATNNSSSEEDWPDEDDLMAENDEPISNDDDDDEIDRDLFSLARAHVPGLSQTPSPTTSAVMFRSSYDEAGDMHINGDILARLFSGPQQPEDKLTDLLRAMAARGHDVRAERACAWIKEHLDEEMDCVPGMIAELRTILDAWF